MRLPTVVKSNLMKIPPVRNAVISRRFETERRLLEGELASKSSHPSIIHFSIDKSATQYVKGILRQCGQENGMIPVHLSDYFFNVNAPYFHQMSKDEFSRFAHVFKPRGFVYTVFSGMIDGLEGLEKYRIVLVVRDPRDVLTSRYFSLAFSHTRPADPKKGAMFDEHRQKMRNISIDDFVLKEAEPVGQRYEGYMNGLLGRPNVHLTKYEDMIAGFPAWLDSLLKHCDLEISPATREAICKTAESAVPDREDIYRHRRQVIPGDHKRKLKPETIAILDQKLRPILGAFDYPMN